MNNKNTLLKKFIFPINFIFLENIYKFCYEKIFAENCCQFLLQNILYKTLFTPNFVGNIYEFYNFIKNNYPQKNYLSIKISEKIVGKNLFSQIYLTNL